MDPMGMEKPLVIEQKTKVCKLRRVSSSFDHIGCDSLVGSKIKPDTVDRPKTKPCISEQTDVSPDQWLKSLKYTNDVEKNLFW